MVSLQEATAHGGLVILAVPFLACGQLLPSLAPLLHGKVVVDATNPLGADWSPLLLGQENSAAEEIARLLPGARVVKAFNTVFADVMTPARLMRRGGCVTAFVAGDDATAVAAVEQLAQSIGFAPLAVGPLRLARHLEAIAHLNIAVCGRTGSTDAAFLFDQAAA